ncbi:hypothetical protein [Pseudoxanthomonas sacheonensis]|uniref:hypothetical protein n=1 Tax=Pseudoxanthomonas sacheonensis TaxID=443615 RepID=UPI0013CFD425|nr:hypothetical protein [Pseudoxanthomonas sacheonensis]
MNLERSLIALLSLSTVSGCSSLPPTPVGALTPSILNADKEKYDGQVVKVVGWMRSESEMYGLWESKSANKEGSYAKNCVSLRIPTSMDTAQFNKRYVEIEATFISKLPADVIRLGACNTTTLQLAGDALPKILNQEK